MHGGFSDPFVCQSMSLPFLKRTNAKEFSGNWFSITMPTKTDVDVDVTMKVTVFRDVIP